MPPAVPPQRFELGPDDELLAWFGRAISDDEASFVRAVAGILGTALARLRSEEQMRHAALHDPLTGLANRTLLRDRLEHALARSARDEVATGVLFIDLDEFKRVNDRFGHAAGDAVLAELGQRLRAAVRPADTVARLGGDEFVVVCEAIDERTALALGHRLDAAIRQPLSVAGAEHHAHRQHRHRARARRPRVDARRGRRRRLPGQGGAAADASSCDASAVPEIELAQGTVRYRDEGAGPAIVFIHGALVDGRLWEPVVDRLVDGARCIVPDLPLGAHRDRDAARTPTSRRPGSRV